LFPLESARGSTFFWCFVVAHGEAKVRV
jgi:hypothetical protein